VQGGVVVTGATQSSDFPVTGNARQRVFSGDSSAMPNGSLDTFVAHFSTSGDRLYSSYFGIADKREYGTAVAADSGGTVGIALAGLTNSCMLRYEIASQTLSEECWKLVLNDPLALTFVLFRGWWSRRWPASAITQAPQSSGYGTNTFRYAGRWSQQVP
jgi:hypothetical protein